MLLLTPSESLVPPCAGEALRMTIVVLSSPPSSVTVAASADSWITDVQYRDLKGGVSVVSFSVDHNPAAARSGALRICTANDSASLGVHQYSGRNTQTQIDQILGAPMVMEFGIATKYIAQQIAKLPPEAQPVAIAAVEALYPILGAALTAARESFVFLPTPEPVFSQPPIPVPVTAQCILRQTEMQMADLPFEVAEAQ